SALNVRAEQVPKAQAASMRHAMQKALELGWFGSAQAQPLLDLVARLYPLHPTVLPVLIKVFTRFGQNERSLFSFLLSHEPFGLQDFAGQGIGSGRFYHLHNLYDYTRATFGHNIGLQSYRNHWHLIESIVSNF